MDKDTKDQMVKILIPVIIVIILLVAGKSFLSGIWDGIKSPFKSAGEGLGITNTDAQDKAIAAAEAAALAAAQDGTAFDPNYYKKVGAKVYTYAESSRIAKLIYDSIGAFYDSPEETLAAIKICTKKSQLSFVAKVFSDKYKKDLLTWLEQKLDRTDQKVIFGKILIYANKLK